MPPPDAVPPLPSPPARHAGPAPSATRSPDRAAVARRITGIDIARALAIIGMVMVHFGPFEPDTSDPAGWLYRTSHGRASFLFVLLAGVGVSLLAGDTSRDRMRRTWTTVAWRFLIFLPLGLWLQGLDTPVAVILQYYAVYYLLAAALTRLPDRALLLVTAVWAVAGPTLLLWVRIRMPEFADRGIVTDPTRPLAIVRDLLVTGFYPLLAWAPPLLAGLWIGRRALRDPAVQRRLLLAGVALAAVAYATSELLRRVVGVTPAEDPGWSTLAVAEGHSGTPLNTIGATGVAVAILAACLLVGARLPRLTWPLAAAGQLAFTIYVGHIIVLHLTPDLLEAREGVGAAWASVARFTAVVLVLSTLWRAAAPRGPLEALLHLPTRLSARRREVPGDPPPPSLHSTRR